MEDKSRRPATRICGGYWWNRRGLISISPNVQGRVLRRQKALALSEEAKKIAWKAQQRLHKRYTTMAARGKHKGQIVTALARELLGFIWAIAVETESQFELTKAA